MHLRFDGLDFDNREFLAMSARAAIAFAAFHFENNDFFAAFVFENFCRDARAWNRRRADFGRVAFASEDDVVNRDRVARFGFWIAVDKKNVAFLDSELSSLRDDCRFHCCRKNEGLGNNVARTLASVFCIFFEEMKKQSEGCPPLFIC